MFCLRARGGDIDQWSEFHSHFDVHNIPQVCVYHKLFWPLAWLLTGFFISVPSIQGWFWGKRKWCVQRMWWAVDDLIWVNSFTQCQISEKIIACRWQILKTCLHWSKFTVMKARTRWRHFLFKGVTHNRSPGQKNHLFLRGFKYICSHFDPFFIFMKTGTNYPLKTTLFCPFEYTLYKITPFFIHFKNTQKTSFFITCT